MAPAPATTSQSRTPLQQHAAFFDRNGDGIVYPWETYTGFRALGFSIFLSSIAAVLVNGFLSYSTLDSWIPSIRFPIYVKNINKAIHGSDTGVYNKEGRVVSEEFEQVFAKFAVSRADALSFRELWNMTERKRDSYDVFGPGASKLEWLFTYLLAKDAQGYVSKQAIAGIYDGSYFYDVEKQRKRT